MIEAQSKGTPEEEREKLLRKVKEDNQENAIMEKQWACFQSLSVLPNSSCVIEVQIIALKYLMDYLAQDNIKSCRGDELYIINNWRKSVYRLPVQSSRSDNCRHTRHICILFNN